MKILEEDVYMVKLKNAFLRFDSLSAVNVAKEYLRWANMLFESGEVAKCLRVAKKGGGFILSDQHGEISWAVKEEALRGIMDGVNEFGRY